MSRLFQRFGNRKIVTTAGTATMEFDRGLQKAFDQLETQIADLTQIVLDIQAAQAAADAAAADAAAADDKARAHMDDLPAVQFTGDYTGTLAADQLPLDIACKRYDGTTNVSATSTWTRTVESGDVTCTIGAATGVLNVTAISTDSVVRIESVRDGLTLRKKQAFSIELSAPPNTGAASGGTSWTDTTLGSTSSNTMATISDELTVTVGPSGTVTLTAPLNATTTPTAAAASLIRIEVFGIWQWWNGAAWTDLGTETASNPDCVVEYDSDSGTYRVTQTAALSVSSSKSGLVAAASEKFRLQARNGDAFDPTMNYSGTATATTS